MPRIYTSQSDPIDFCINCFPTTQAEAFERYGDLGDGPDLRGNCFGFDDGHPDYDEDEMYHCEVCGRRLIESIDCYWEGSYRELRILTALRNGENK